MAFFSAFFSPAEFTGLTGISAPAGFSPMGVKVLGASPDSWPVLKDRLATELAVRFYLQRQNCDFMTMLSLPEELRVSPIGYEEENDDEFKNREKTIRCAWNFLLDLKRISDSYTTEQMRNEFSRLHGDFIGYLSTNAGGYADDSRIEALPSLLDLPGLTTALGASRKDDRSRIKLAFMFIELGSTAGTGSAFFPGYQELCGQYNAHRTLEIIETLCENIRKAHNIGVILCDLKKDNFIYAKRNGCPTILLNDFDSSVVVKDSNVGTEKICRFTTIYAAPEQLAGDADGVGQGVKTAATDIFSFGLIIYELLNEGRQPAAFGSAEERAEILGSAYREGREIEIEEPANGSPALKKEVVKMLKITPANRTSLSRLKNALSPVGENNEAQEGKNVNVHNEPGSNINQQINADTVYIGVPQAQPQQAPAQPQPAQTGNGGVNFEKSTFNAPVTINNYQQAPAPPPAPAPQPQQSRQQNPSAPDGQQKKGRRGLLDRLRGRNNGGNTVVIDNSNGSIGGDVKIHF